jgi:hypothetical protein
MINNVDLKYKNKTYMTITPMIFEMIEDDMNKTQIKEYLKEIGIEPNLIQSVVDNNFERYEERII